MPGVNEKYDEYKYIEDSSDSMVKDIEEAIKIFSSDLTDLKSNILGWDKSIDLKNYTSINNFYTLEWDKIIFWVNNVRNFLSTVYQRLSWMKVQKFWEVSKENNFTWTILAIQIALKAIDSKKYNIKINWKYKDSKDDPTRNAIKQFQIDKKLQWKDGKPGKETIWTLVKELDIFLKNKKLEREENKKLKKDVADIIEESVNFNPYSWLYSREEKEAIVNYILSWKLNSGENSMLEVQINALSNKMMNWKLKYLIQHSSEPLKNNIQNIKAIEEEKRNNFKQDLEDLNSTPTDKRETIKKWWDKISEDMFQQLLIMEWGQWYKAQIHRKFKEKFPTWPYGMVYKHIDQQWNLLKNIVPFKNWERVSKEWALNNARAYYNKRAQEWKSLLDEKWYKYTQSQLDSLVSASWWTENATKKLKSFVLWHRNDKNWIYNFLITFARTAKWKIQWGLVARRKLEANWFMWTKKSYIEYQQEYAQNRSKNKKRK